MIIETDFSNRQHFFFFCKRFERLQIAGLELVRGVRVYADSAIDIVVFTCQLKSGIACGHITRRV